MPTGQTSIFPTHHYPGISGKKIFIFLSDLVSGNRYVIVNQSFNP